MLWKVMCLLRVHEFKKIFSQQHLYGFDQMPGHHTLAKLPHIINPHRSQYSFSPLEELKGMIL